MKSLRIWIPALALALAACVPAIVEPPTPFPPSEPQVPPTEEAPAIPATEVPTATAEPPEVELPAQPVLVPHLEAGQPVVIDQIWMDTAKEGWAIGSHPDPNLARPIHVLRTADGGQTWREVTPPADNALVAEVGGIYSAGASVWVIYLGTDRVWRTTDGGSTWSASPAGYPMGQYSTLDFSDPQHGWILQEIESGMGNQLVALFKTTDAGDTWKEIINPYDSEDLQSCFKTGLSFFGADTGWVTYDCQGNYVEAFLDKSADGGETWTQGQLPVPEGAAKTTDGGWCYSNTPNLTSEKTGWLIVTCNVAEDSTVRQTSHLYRTKDAGETWAMLNYPGGEPMFFADGTILALDRGQHRSTDDGATWTKIKSVAWDGQYSFVDPNNGWAVATNEDEIALVKTTDGGATWEIIEPLIAAD